MDYQAQYDMVWGSSDRAENCIFEIATGKTAISNTQLAQMGTDTWNLMGLNPQRLDRWVRAQLAN